MTGIKILYCNFAVYASRNNTQKSYLSCVRIIEFVQQRANERCSMIRLFLRFFFCPKNHLSFVSHYSPKHHNSSVICFHSLTKTVVDKFLNCQIKWTAYWGEKRRANVCHIALYCVWFNWLWPKSQLSLQTMSNIAELSLSLSSIETSAFSSSRGMLLSHNHERHREWEPFSIEMFAIRSLSFSRTEKSRNNKLGAMLK